MRIRYWIQEYGDGPNDSVTIDVPAALGDDVDDYVENCAEDFHANHDGWEATWPITFCVQGAGDSRTGWGKVQVFVVDRESRTHFSARPARIER